MTPINLISTMAKNLREVVKDYKFIAELQNPKPVTVYEQYLPTDRFEDDTFYPLIIVTCRQVDFISAKQAKYNGERIATLILTLGVYGGDKDDGWRDLFNMAERITQFLATAPILPENYFFNRPVLEGKFVLEKFPVFEPLAEQPEPFYFGNILTQYQLAAPVF